MPAVQYPHCNPCSSWKACWTGWSRPSMAKPFDGGDRRAVGLDGENGAGLHALPLEQDRAGPAGRGVAADLGAGEAEHVAQVEDQQEPGIHVVRGRCTVDRDADLHERPPGGRARYVVATGVATTSTVRARRCKGRGHLGPAEPLFTASGSIPDRAADDLHLPGQLSRSGSHPGVQLRRPSPLRICHARVASWRLKRVPGSDRSHSPISRIRCRRYFSVLRCTMRAPDAPA